ncbi:aspartate aminotransferase family protein [Anaerocolumna sp.]|uniref:aspartate aminotransferase family protein n=1 Tax=Anaerocolumna sp. TaxID=2041569 RepID=UPI0028AB99FC|nr:aminotransferase class III-fold pyridoxal phosphate-dependent enzyme [Anaerocolumna sp.]
MSEMQEYHERVKKILPGGVHYNFNLPWEESPIHYQRTKDSRVWDMDGKEYLDLYARFGAMILGHGNKEYSDSLKDVIDRILSVSHCDLDAEALEAIHQFIPSAEMIRFGLSGTEIVQNAIRIARAYTGRNRFVRFNNHYHGNADNIMGGHSTNKENPIPIDYIGDTKGTEGRANGILEDQSYLIEWNNAELLENLLEKHGEEIAAVIMEPVCVNGGSIMPAPGYLQKVRQLCDTYGIVLIFDEIITGFRMGLGGAQMEFGVTPDLTTLAKAIAGGGVPVAAIAGKKEIMQLLTEKRVIHAGTFNGYPLGTAAVKTTIDILSRDNGVAYESMKEHVDKIYEILRKLAKEEKFPLIVQGPVLCGAYHCCETELKKPSEYTSDIQIKDVILNSALRKNGILVSSISRIYPNITLSRKDVDWFEERAGQAIREAKQLIDELYE